jgi:hypothetical protein
MYLYQSFIFPPSGQTFFINVPDKKQRPSSSATIQSTDSRDQFTMYPYKGTLSTEDDVNKPRPTKQTHNIRAKTAPPGSRISTENERKTLIRYYLV